MAKRQFILIIAVFFSIIFCQQDTLSNIGSKSDVTVTVHAENTNLSTILAILAGESGFNIVTGPTVNREDKLTIHLEKTPVDQAINLVVRAAGLSYEIVGNSILVASHSKLNEEVGITSHVITLDYADATEVKDLLVNLTEQIEVDKSGNKLLINASPKTISEIENIVEQIDVPALQIMLEARLIEVAVSDEEELGIDWNRLSKLTTILAETGVPNFELGGSLLPGATQTENTDGSVNEEFKALPLGMLPDAMYFQRLDPENGLSFSRQLTAFDVTLDLLLKNNQAEVLANSQVVTLNGREATISMVDIVPYILSSGGVGGQVQVQREEIGIKLRILPTVNTDGYITTKITPEVSSIFDFIGPDRNIPWVKKRISTTTIRVKDNETIIIAGLLAADKKYSVNRLPLLWRIPWFGEKLFTHTIESETKTDLIIQITPQIVRDNYSHIKKSQQHKSAELMMPSENNQTITPIGNQE